MKIGKILAGVDLGEDTERVLAYASLFAKRTGASLNLLTVIDYLVTPPAYLVPYIEEEKRLMEERFHAWEKRIEGYGVRARKEVMVGRLHESFEAASKETKADLLVLGFRSHVLRKSSSERLIKGLQMPMLVVRGEKSDTTIGAADVKRVLCPVDFSAASTKALGAARELAGIFSAVLDVIHVLQSHMIADMMKTEADREKVKTELLHQAKGALDTLLRGAGIEKEGVIAEGEPYKEITSFSEKNDTDLIVMGARGLSPIKGMLIGSVTDAVLKSSPCPVAVIH